MPVLDNIDEDRDLLTTQLKFSTKADGRNWGRCVIFRTGQAVTFHNQTITTTADSFPTLAQEESLEDNQKLIDYTQPRGVEVMLNRVITDCSNRVRAFHDVMDL